MRPSRNPPARQRFPLQNRACQKTQPGGKERLALVTLRIFYLKIPHIGAHRAQVFFSLPAQFFFGGAGISVKFRYIAGAARANGIIYRAVGNMLKSLNNLKDTIGPAATQIINIQPAFFQH